jgi:hypothetical protein
MDLEFLFKIKVLIFSEKLNCPENSRILLEKAGLDYSTTTAVCNPAPDRERDGIFRLHLAQL